MSAHQQAHKRRRDAAYERGYADALEDVQKSSGHDPKRAETLRLMATSLMKRPRELRGLMNDGHPLSRRDDRVDVTVRFPGGSRYGKFPFWMADAAIIRDTIEALGPMAPRTEDCSVERRNLRSAG